MKAERLNQAFRDHSAWGGAVVPPGRVAETLAQESLVLTRGDCRYGFRADEPDLWVLGEDHLFGRRRPVPQVHEVALEKTAAVDLAELRPGDYVVHRDHGIGRYLGLERLQYGRHGVEAAAIEYQGGDRLYVPVDRLDVLTKYRSFGEDRPRLDRMGGRTWRARKRRVKKAAARVVRELAELYARRSTLPGFAFPPDDELQEAFEGEFEHVLTPDQERAVREIKRDMERPRPMDRLLCGDVGFGKTEVAVRAAFKAVNAGKQVVVLAPTTVLAMQHFQRFQMRFAEFPVRIAMLSRLVPPSEQRNLLDRVRKGDVDILIGTHRLLGKDLEFFDLGLVVIDEEQRFGVMQKERWKRFARQVDVLSMTATPIPRTLQMALTGLTRISTIRTPPRDRLAVQTYVLHFSPEVVAAAVEHEMERGGQVFVVHNEIRTLDAFAERLREWVPMARMVVAHGRMPPRRLEQEMMRFIQGQADVLVSTAIIENGLDLPNVNTLIVHQAHRFGLAQLYQLRGRVGRSQRRAYAYFLVPPAAELSETARKRLAALKEFTELGSGFRLAALDLELRGAGELLGKRQHGHVATVGFDTYLELIREAAAELQQRPYRPPPSVVLRVPETAEIPVDYMPSQRHRFYYYRRLGALTDPDQVEALRAELRDLYGPLPPPVEKLLQWTRLRAAAKSRGVVEISTRDREVIMVVRPDEDELRERWVTAVRETPGARFEPPDRVVLPWRKSSWDPQALVNWLVDKIPPQPAEDLLTPSPP